MNDKQNMVSHPSHYNKGNPAYEPYKVIDEWGCNFNIGSAIKYLARYKAKWNPIEDLEKAKQYIDFEIASIRSKAALSEDADDAVPPADENSCGTCGTCSKFQPVDEDGDKDVDEDAKHDAARAEAVKRLKEYYVELLGNKSGRYIGELVESLLQDHKYRKFERANW